MLDFLASLRKHGYKGLSEKDKLSAADKAHCKCVHGHEVCCEATMHADVLHERDALDGHFVHPKHFDRTHYCLTGDEPYCDVVRHKE